AYDLLYTVRMCKACGGIFETRVRFPGIGAPAAGKLFPAEKIAPTVLRLKRSRHPALPATSKPSLPWREDFSAALPASAKHGSQGRQTTRTSRTAPFFTFGVGHHFEQRRQNFLGRP